MKMFGSVGDFFALDIGTTAIRVVQLSRTNGGWNLEKYASVPVDTRVAGSDAPEDLRKLSEVITTAVGQSGIKTKNVVLGAPSTRTFATVIELADMSSAELASTIKYQAEQFIPMSLDEAKVDWAVLGRSPKDPTKNEVLLASIANSFSEQRLDLIESMGFNVVAIEPDSIAVCRALLPANSTGGRVVLDFGDMGADLVVALGDSPRLIRSIPTGLRSLVKAAAQNLSIEEQQATQFILKFGLASDKLEGQIIRSLEATMAQFVGEVVKSIKFFQTKYPDMPVSEILLSGYAATIPGFDAYLSQKVGLPSKLATPWQYVRVPQSDQAALQEVAAQFAVAVGLAEKSDV